MNTVLCGCVRKTRQSVSLHVLWELSCSLYDLNLLCLLSKGGILSCGFRLRGSRLLQPLPRHRSHLGNNRSRLFPVVVRRNPFSSLKRDSPPLRCGLARSSIVGEEGREGEAREGKERKAGVLMRKVVEGKGKGWSRLVEHHPTPPFPPLGKKKYILTLVKL